MLTEPGDELTDLAPQDAEELRAFLEKRRWFEQKLKVLVEAPTIYPFLHPVLITADDDADEPFARQGASLSEYQLPTVKQVRQWQHERDALEEEVFDFDGGDLVRMKEKTRAITRVPLTAPSTHLVSIVLDLIVLIDRILTLLRHRAELLELTSLRLQWDQIRWSVMEETRKIRLEVDSFVREKAHSTPVHYSSELEDATGIAGSHAGVSSAPQARSREQTPLTSIDEVLQIPLAPETSLPLQTSRASDVAQNRSPIMDSSHFSPRSTSSTLSPSRSSSTPKRSLLIPLLHSQLVNLRIRHRNLTSTQVIRSGALLDRIIDVAGPLKDLGDVNGPRPGGTAEQSGAVPDQLLDAQDALEAETVEMGQWVKWCEELQKHWQMCEVHHNGSMECSRETHDLLGHLHQALSQPATSKRHRSLAGLLQNAQSHLPIPLDQSFSQPSHPAYPENDEHNASVVATLTIAWAEANDSLTTARDRLAWYERLTVARERLLDKREALAKTRSDLDETVQLLERGSEERVRPNLNDTAVLEANIERWLSDLPDQTQQVNSHILPARTASQALVLANLQYRNVRKTLPPGMILHQGELYEDEALMLAEQENDECSRCVDLASCMIESSQQDAKILPLAQAIARAAGSIRTSTSALQEQIVVQTRLSAWHSHRSQSHAGSIEKGAISALEKRIKDEVAKPLASLDDLIRKHDRTLPVIRQQLATISSDLIEQHGALRNAHATLLNVTRQAEIARVIEQETERSCRKISVVQDEIDRSAQKSDANVLAEPQFDRIDCLGKEYTLWESSLAERVPFLASHSHSEVVATTPLAFTQLVVLTTSVAIPPIAPPPSVPGTPTLSDLYASAEQPVSPVDLVVVDQAVRAAVNGYAVRVASALEHAKSSLLDILSNAWVTKCHDSSDELDTMLRKWHQTQANFGSQISGLQIKIASDPSSLNAAKATVQAVEALQNIVGLKIPQRKTNLMTALDEFVMIVAGKPDRIGGKEIIKWEATMNAAKDVVGEAENEMNQLVESVEALLSAAKARSQKKQDSSSAPTSPMPSISSDVFGQTFSRETIDHPAEQSSGAEDELEHIQQLEEELNSLRLRLIVEPTVDQLQATPGLQRLPDLGIARKLAKDLEKIKEKVRIIALPPQSSAYVAFANFRVAISAEEQLIPRLHKLAEVGQCVHSCDSSFSSLLELVDRYGHGASSQQVIHSAQSEALIAVKRLSTAAVSVEEDTRVKREVRRVTQAWSEMQSLVDECLHPERTIDHQSRPSSEVSTAPSISSASISRLPRLRGSVSRANNRIVSNPTAQRKVFESPTMMLSPSRIPMSRNRAASDTPSRTKLSSLREPILLPNNLGMTSNLSTPPLLKNENGIRQRTTSIPRPTIIRSSTPSTELGKRNGFNPRPGTRLSSRLPSSTALDKKVKKEYVPDPKSKLDVAVGKIVNKLDVDVPIVPVGQGSTDVWKDQTGQYWIGSEGKAKLCFCRILRSRTVMVRVGGGWIELSKFLLDHFAEAINAWQPLDTNVDAYSLHRSLSKSSTRTSLFGFSDPVTITSASLAASAQRRRPSMPASTSNRSISSILSSADESVSTTPMGRTAPLPPNESTLSPERAATPKHPRRSLSPFPRTPNSADRAVLASGSPSSTPGGGSPLVALQFIRKASESPSMREKEKERFVGRRSILSKDRE